MKDKVIQNIINRMNLLGKSKIPFLFVIDFEFNDPLVYTLSELSCEKIAYKVEDKTNYTAIKNSPAEIYFQIFPGSFDSYKHKFDLVLEEINKGNTYLLNLTDSTKIEINFSLEEVFAFSSAKYKLYIRDKFVCFSPECFVKITDGKIESFPMKGTIDALIENAEKAIIEDKKETAEHYTIVDLIRNDLSIVAENVLVEKFRYIEKIKTIKKDLLQVSSVVSGYLNNEYASQIGEIIFSLLPAGSISGAPKRKTIELIRSIESQPRGYYTGVFGIFDGVNLDSAVMIRFIEQTSLGFVFKSGGGITYLSNAQSEYNELLDKIYVPIDRND